MAPKKKTVKKSVKTARTKVRYNKSVDAKHEMVDAKTESLLNLPVRLVQNPNVQKFWKTPSFYIGLAVLVVVGLLLLSKSWFLAATVNGSPIFRWDLNRVLVSRFGQQTLEGMVSEKLIADEADKSGVVVSQPELDAKVKEITSGFGENVSLEDLLQFQGMTKEEFEKQLKLQITVEKLVGRDVTVTDQEITDYIATNSATMTATDEATLRNEAAKAVSSEKINEKMQTWFAELKEKAKILRFL